ncbi:DMT family transporter [Acuticoccus sp. I52.16.1]|uniref:DMT family transporter n=1 Tax=Acuticoccus sp. I52.16.1 TaxID=2928472 RepID=UPI001FD0E415|nr:DMT family transporter [Acuticoccus sp. I52.16.1]UOM36266.1 DMT family transporter [Acuticoccus sp. I52.16.1]
MADLDAKPLGWAFLSVTALGWGLGWPMIKIAMEDWPPLFARGAAGLVAAFGLLAVGAVRRDVLLPPRSACGPILVAAFTNVFAWMGLTALALLWLNVSEAALVTFTMPIWATLFAWPLLGQRPRLADWAAIALGFGGLVVLFGTRPDGAADDLPGIGLALTAAICFALGSVLLPRPVPLTPTVRTGWLIGIGSAMMIAASVVIDWPELGALTGRGAAALGYMALFPMALCYLAWFAAASRLPVATASTGLLMIPIIGAVSTALMLGEPLGPRAAVAFALTLGGVAIAMRSSPAAL